MSSYEFLICPRPYKVINLSTISLVYPQGYPQIETYLDHRLRVSVETVEQTSVYPAGGQAKAYPTTHPKRTKKLGCVSKRNL
jgi:hypothetical protein